MNVNIFDISKVRDKANKGWTWEQCISFFLVRDKEQFESKLKKICKKQPNDVDTIIAQIDENTRIKESSNKEQENANKAFKNITKMAKEIVKNRESNSKANMVSEKENCESKETVKDSNEFKLKELINKKTVNEQLQEQLKNDNEKMLNDENNVKKKISFQEENIRVLTEQLKQANSELKKLMEQHGEIENQINENSNKITQAEEEHKNIETNIKKLTRVTLYCGVETENCCEKYNYYIDNIKIDAKKIKEQFYELTDGELGLYTAKDGKRATKIIIAISEIKKKTEYNIVVVFEQKDRIIAEIVEKMVNDVEIKIK